MSVMSRLAIASANFDFEVKRFLRNLLLVNTAAAAGSSATDATALTAGKNVVTAADGAKGVILPVAELDMTVAVVNTVAGEDLLVYPNTGGQLNALTVTTGAFSVPGGQEAVFYCDDIDHWYVRAGTASSVYDATTGITAFATGGQTSATALTSEFNNVTTCATAGDSVKLPAAALGKRVTIKNSGAASLAVFPASADSINALAVNLSVNIPVGSELTFDAISGVVWETKEFLTSLAPTTQRGEFVFKASDNAADHEVILTNASHGQATTTTVPDPAGATGTVVLEEITNVFDLPQRYDANTTITAFATGGQASATALTGEFNNVTTCATAGDSVKLPAAAQGLKITVKNSGAASLAVFPADADSINALAINLSVNIPVGGELTFRAISAVVWETNEVFVSPAPTTQKGEFVFKAADNAADHEVIFTNASHGQATTTTVPDPLGATGTVVLEELTNVFDLPQRYDANTTITAFATGGQGSATALTGEFNNVTTCATASDSVALPAAAAGLKVTVKNSGATALAVFPATGDAINALAANLSVDIAVNGQMTFRAIDATTWETEEFLISQAPSTQKGSLVVKAADSAGNTVTTVTNASQAAARVYTVPDAGADASFIMTEGAQTINGAKTFGGEADFAGNTTGAPGAGFTNGVGAIHKAGVMKVGTIIKTSILLDLTGTASSTTDLDIIGSGASAAHIGQITAAKNGTILTGRMTCLEAPVGGVTDIDLYAATEATGVYDSAVGDLTETAQVTSGAAWTNGRELSFTAWPAANAYLYLTGGGAGVPGTYTAGKFLIELEGYDA